MQRLKVARAFGLAVALVVLVQEVSAAAPGAATLVTPARDIAGSTIAFTWNPVAGSSWYLLWVGVGSSPVLQQWFTATEAGCAGGGTCTAVLTPGLRTGSYVWYIRTYGSGANGPWSAALSFTIKDLPSSWSRTLGAGERFTLVLDGQAVLDNETGLVWQRTPSTTKSTWTGAGYACMYAASGSRLGWHLATISELESLVDTTQQNPTLPAGHPFVLGSDFSFWSQTGSLDTATNGLLLNFSSNFLFQAAKSSWQARGWCVRGGNGVPIQ